MRQGGIRDVTWVKPPNVDKSPRDGGAAVLPMMTYHKGAFDRYGEFKGAVTNPEVLKQLMKLPTGPWAELTLSELVLQHHTIVDDFGHAIESPEDMHRAVAFQSKDVQTIELGTNALVLS